LSVGNIRNEYLCYEHIFKICNIPKRKFWSNLRYVSLLRLTICAFINSNFLKNIKLQKSNSTFALIKRQILK
jgi:hypothetical protein